MADIAKVLADFAAAHPEAAADLVASLGEATPAAPASDTEAADQIRSGGLFGLVRRLVTKVLEPMSGPEQDAVDEVLAPHKPAPAAPAEDPAS